MTQHQHSWEKWNRAGADQVCEIQLGTKAGRVFHEAHTLARPPWTHLLLVWIIAALYTLLLQSLCLAMAPRLAAHTTVQLRACG